MSTTERPICCPRPGSRARNAIIGPNDDIIRPGATRRLDYETEMAAVIGVRCKNVPRERAMEVIAGYTVANDVTARDVGRMERAEGNRLPGYISTPPAGPLRGDGG